MRLPLAFSCNWHPCSQMQDYEIFPELHVERAQGSVIYLKGGKRLIDAVSSWWCKPLGHGNERLRRALSRQAERFEHVIFANTTHSLALKLGKKLGMLLPSMNKVFYACDGSSAVEIALKMSLQYHRQNGADSRTKFAFLENSYHGETIFCYSVSDLGLYQDKFKAVIHKNPKITGLRYLDGPLNERSFETYKDWASVERQLNEVKEELAGVIVEPLVQGAAGFRMYSADLLSRLRAWTEANRCHLIADEIMTGLGRVGKKLAVEYAGVTPDFICIMKGLGAGWMPFGAVLTRQEIFDAFYDDYLTGKAFMHSNTFTGHALGMAVALEALKIYQEQNYYEMNCRRGKILYEALDFVRDKTGCLDSPRQLGFVAAADLRTLDGFPPDPRKRTGYRVYEKAVENGVLLRPLGDTLYLLPPFTIEEREVQEIAEAMILSINAVMERDNS